MGKQLHDEPFSMFHVLDMEFFPMKKNLEPLVIIPCGLSFIILNIFNIHDKMRL
jgi:hypothetical protein